METLTEHHLEAAVSGPPPRPLRLPFATLALSAIALLLFALFLAGGARALWEAAKLGWLATSGTPIAARIVAIDTLPAVAAGEPPLQTAVHYTYSDPFTHALHPPQTLRLSAPAPPEGTPLATVGPLPARVAAAAPLFHVGDTLLLRQAHWFGQTLLVPWPASPGGRIAFLAFCGGLIFGVSLLLMRRLWLWTARRMHLLRFGIATVGTITHKHSQAEEGAHYFVRYGYGDAQTPPAPFEHEEQVTAEQWKRLEIGQPVTVLYDPAHPAVSGLYTLLRGG